jgi:hypothetical protein
LNQCMKFKNYFGGKTTFWSIMKLTFNKKKFNMSQGLPNPGFRAVRVENWDFLKKDSQDFKNSFEFGFWPDWNAKLESAYSLFIIVKILCGLNPGYLLKSFVVYTYDFFHFLSCLNLNWISQFNYFFNMD